MTLMDMGMSSMNDIRYGFESARSCIFSNECSNCLAGSGTTTVPPQTCNYFGFDCCVNRVDNPAYDSNGHAYVTEVGFFKLKKNNGKSCVNL